MFCNWDYIESIPFSYNSNDLFFFLKFVKMVKFKNKLSKKKIIQNLPWSRLWKHQTLAQIVRVKHIHDLYNEIDFCETIIATSKVCDIFVILWCVFFAWCACFSCTILKWIVCRNLCCVSWGFARELFMACSFGSSHYFMWFEK